MARLAADEGLRTALSARAFKTAKARCGGENAGNLQSNFTRLKLAMNLFFYQDVPFHIN